MLTISVGHKEPRTWQTVTARFHMVEESSIVISTSSYYCFRRSIYTFKCPVLRTNVCSRNNQNSLTSGDIYSKQHREHLYHCDIMVELLMAHSHISYNTQFHIIRESSSFPGPKAKFVGALSNNTTDRNNTTDHAVLAEMP